MKSAWEEATQLMSPWKVPAFDHRDLLVLIIITTKTISISNTNKMKTIPTTTKMKNLPRHHRLRPTTSICLAQGHLHLLLKKRFRGRVQLRVEPLQSYSKLWWYCWWLWCIYSDDSVVNEYELARTCLPCRCGLEDKIWRRSSMQSGSCFGLLIF